MLQTDYSQDFSHFKTFDTFFREMIGDLGDYDDLSDTVDYYYVLYAFFFISSIVLSIVLMNLLISIIGDTFGQVKANEELARHFEICNIIYDIDAELNIKKEKEYYLLVYPETTHQEISDIQQLRNKINQNSRMIKNIDYHLEMIMNKQKDGDYNIAHKPEKKSRVFAK